MKSSVIAMALMLLLALGATAAPAPPAPPPSEEARAYQHYATGQRAFLAGRWKDAAQALEKAVAGNSKLMDAWYLLGIADFQLGVYDKAEKAFLEVVSINGHHYNAWVQLANTSLARGDYDKAREYARSIFKFDKKSFLAYYALGVVDYQQGHLKDSRDNWERSRAIYDEFGPTFFNLGVAEYNANNPQMAIARLRKAILLDQKKPLYLFTLGWFAFMYHDNATGFNTFRRVLDAENAGAYANAGRSLMALQQGKYEEASKQAELALKADPELVKAWVLKGLILAHDAKKADAETAFREALALDPLDRDAREALTHLGVTPPPVEPARLPSQKPKPAPSASPSPSPAPSPKATSSPQAAPRAEPAMPPGIPLPKRK